jgi:hypothetical protein
MTTKEFLTRYLKDGNERFYRFLLSEAIDKLVRIEAGLEAASPEIDLLAFAERFTQLYRKEGNTSYLELSRLFRKAGHKVYRLMLKKSLTHKNPKFLQAV